MEDSQLHLSNLNIETVREELKGLDCTNDSALNAITKQLKSKPELSIAEL